MTCPQISCERSVKSLCEATLLLKKTKPIILGSRQLMHYLEQDRARRQIEKLQMAFEAQLEPTWQYAYSGKYTMQDKSLAGRFQKGLKTWLASA